MKVRVSDGTVDYVSDYPKSWSTISGDYFKIEQLDDTPCFIKRFEKKSPDQISGWRLLSALRGQNNSDARIPRIFDIKVADPNESGVYYVFYECLKGRTIDTLPSLGANREVRILKDDLFTALDFLNEQGFWFPDLIEKNVFRENSGKYYLIDLDSTHPLSTPPGNGLYGDQFYLNTVMRYYQEVLKQNQNLAQLGGEVLNRLQAIFMILNARLKIEEKKQGKNPGNNYDILHLCLDATMPKAKSLFRECAKGDKSSNNKIKELCDELVTVDLVVPKEEVAELSRQKPDEVRETERKGSDFEVVLLEALRSRATTHVRFGRLFLGVLALIVVAALISRQADDDDKTTIALIVLALSILTIIPNGMLIKFSSKLEKGLKESNPVEINASLQHLRSFVTFQLVLRTIFVLGALYFLFMIVTRL
jgi:hypothetical protein